jgi:DNA-binding transcriptional MerR regulator
MKKPAPTTAPWTLSELAVEVAAQLERNYEAADNGQVRAVPDERSIRYYTTLGLVDRPAAMRGRTALYGTRHLAQVVAIKRMQAVGRSLAEVQRLLPTLDDATLARISGVTLGRRGGRRERGDRFWSSAPVAVASPAPAGAFAKRVASGTALDAAAPVLLEEPGVPERAPGEDPTSGFVPAVTLALAAGVTLTFTPARTTTAADADTLRRAAAPLLAELARRRLLAPDDEDDTRRGR